MNELRNLLQARLPGLHARIEASRANATRTACRRKSMPLRQRGLPTAAAGAARELPHARRRRGGPDGGDGGDAARLPGLRRRDRPGASPGARRQVRDCQGPSRAAPATTPATSRSACRCWPEKPVNTFLAPARASSRPLAHYGSGLARSIHSKALRPPAPNGCAGTAAPARRAPARSPARR